MKDIIQSKYFKCGLTAFLVIVAAMLLNHFIDNIGNLIGLIGGFLKILTSLIIGLVIAYLLNPVVKFFEKKVYKGVKSSQSRRNLSIATTYVIAVVVAVTIIGIVVPQLLSSIILLIQHSDQYATTITNFVRKTVIGENNFNSYSVYINDFTNNLKNSLPALQNAFSTISNGVGVFVSGFFNLLIGIVFSVYILANTKDFAGGTRKTLYAFFNVEKVNNFINKVNYVNGIFLKFIIGKITDSSIVCLSTLLFVLICGYPYPLLIAILIGITDLIPYFGPYIGTIPSAIIIAVVNPIKAIIFILFIICLQQIDSNFITPRIQSNATGLPSFWVLFAITVFGGLFGVIGLLIGVPCFTIIYEIVRDFINDNLRKKSLPVETDYYTSSTQLEEKRIKAKLSEE